MVGTKLLCNLLCLQTAGHHSCWRVNPQIVTCNTTCCSTAVISVNGTNANQKVVAYCDSNFAGDTSDLISTYGCASMLYGAAFDLTSKKQEKVAHSRFEAEYVAASLTAKEALWVQKLMADCDLTGPFTIYIDNTAALKDAQSRGSGTPLAIGTLVCTTTSSV